MTQRNPTLLTALLAAALTAACGDDAVEPITPTTVTVSPASATLQSLGSTVQLTATVQDQNGQAMSGITVAWTSSDTEVGTVDESGLMTAVGNGTVTVTATAWSATGTASVAVDQVAAKVVVDPATDTLMTSGDTLRLSADALDSNGNAVAGAVFAWASTDTLVAVVDDEGLVTGVSAGEVEVTATSEGSTGRARLTVAAPVPTTVAISPDTVAFNALGQAAQLAAEVRDQVSRVMEGEPVSWSSADTLVATVDSTGLATAMRTGATTVAATAGSASATAVVTVTQSAGRVVVSPPAATIALGDTLRLTAEAFDENGHAVADAEFDWSSTDPSVARVDGRGLVTGVGEGRATVTVEADGARATAEITVENPDRAALVALYNATDGPNWVDNTNWLTDAPLGEWYGVTTDATGRVVALNLRGKPKDPGYASHGLSGQIPIEVGLLASLRSLDLIGNDLSGPIPPELGQLANLQTLDLSQNSLSGEIPPELSGLAKLRNLFLGDNGLSGTIPPELGDLAELRRLNLAGNRLSGSLPPQLGNLANLTSLRLNVNDLSGAVPSELGNLRNLSHLSLHYNKFSGPLPHSMLATPLQFLGWNCGAHGLCVPGTSEFVKWLGGIAKDGPFCNQEDQATMANFYDLVSGERWHNSTGWLSGPALEEWQGVQTDSLGRVTTLDLSANGLSGGLPASIASLTQLTQLRLNDNGLKGRLPLALTRLSLDEFDYEGTELCEPTNERFQTWRDGIRSHRSTGKKCTPITDDRDVLVALYEATGGPNWRNNRNWLSDAPLGQWHGVSVNDRGRVVTVSLVGNDLSGVIPPELGGLAELRNLTFLGNDLLGPIPSELSALAQLRILDLRSNGLTGTIPPHLGAMAELRILNLGRNGLTGIIPPELGAMAKLGWLDLRDNSLSGIIPPQVGDLAELGGLILRGNHLTGPIPLELGRLTKLAELDLRQNALVGPVPSELGSLRNLKHLGLARNPEMSGALPLGFTNLDLESIQAGGTDVCAPKEPTFEAWLDAVPEHWIAWCVSRPMPYLTQAIQSHAHPVPLVAGEDALLRVFVTAARETTEGMPTIRARFFLNGTERHRAETRRTSVRVPVEHVEGDLSKTVNAEVPGWVIQPGVEMIVEIDPDGALDPDLEIGRRIPDTGRIALDVREMPVLRLTVIPFLWSEHPDSAVLDAAAGMAAHPQSHPTLRHTRRLLPVDSIVVRAHDPVLTASMGTPYVLPQVSAIRALEGGSGHYMGLASGPVTPVPSAWIGGWESVSDLRPEAIAHELGHNMSLRHAPCGAAGGLDPSYPYSNGSIGAWGYNSQMQQLVRPDTPDLMSYCNRQWISSYHFTKALRYRLAVDRESATPSSDPTRSLLLWGGVDPMGKQFLNPVFVIDAPISLPDSGGDHTVIGRDADGGELFSMSFAMPSMLSEEDEISSSFAFVVPVQPGWESALATITLSGPDGTVTLDGDTDQPMAILRDPVTGQVRGFLRDLPLESQAAMDAAGRAVEPGLQVLFSRGIPDPEEWRR